MLERSYIVTVSSGDQTRTRVWNGRGPMPLGHPYRWILERNNKGVRIRDLSSKEGEIVESRVSDIDPELIESGLPVLIPNSSASVRIKPIATLAPAYNSRPNPAGKIQVYSCMGSWSLGSVSVGAHYLAKIRDRSVFEIRKVAEGYVLVPLVPDLTIEIQSTPVDLVAGRVRILDHKEICQTVIRWGLMNWIFSSFENVAIPSLTTRQKDAERGVFRRSLGVAAVVLGVLMLATLLLPKSRSVDIAPQQYSKIVLEEHQKATAAPAQGESSQADNRLASSKPVQGRVTQAFRAQALQSAVDGLLRGGMTKLLNDSQFVSGTGNSDAARRLLKADSQALVSTAPIVGMLTTRSVKVASVGGSGTGTTGQEKVGYSSGDHAAVSGQGKSFLSLDTGGSSVEEGLTKDEVGEVIHRHLSEIRYCYEAAMVRTPDVEGKLLLGFTIGGTGSVKSEDVRNSTLTDPGLDDCVLRRLANWKFPQTKGGIDVAVNYPFIFKSLGR